MALMNDQYRQDFMDDEGSAEKKCYWPFCDVWSKSGRRAVRRYVLVCSLFGPMREI